MGLVADRTAPTLVHCHSGCGSPPHYYRTGKYSPFSLTFRYRSPTASDSVWILATIRRRFLPVGIDTGKITATQQRCESPDQRSWQSLVMSATFVCRDAHSSMECSAVVLLVHYATPV